MRRKVLSCTKGQAAKLGDSIVDQIVGTAYTDENSANTARKAVPVRFYTSLKLSSFKQSTSGDTAHKGM